MKFPQATRTASIRYLISPQASADMTDTGSGSFRWSHWHRPVRGWNGCSSQPTCNTRFARKEVRLFNCERPERNGGPGVYLVMVTNTRWLSNECIGETKGRTQSPVGDDDTAEAIVYVGPEITPPGRAG